MKPPARKGRACELYFWPPRHFSRLHQYERAMNKNTSIPRHRRTPLPLVLTMAAIWQGLLPITSAAPFVWDQNGAAAGTGGTGAWDTTSLFWDSGANVWGNTSADEAIFGGTAGTLTAGAGITSNKLSFATTGYTITGNLTMAGTTPTIDTGSLASTTYSGILNGTSGLVKAGSGSLFLTSTAKQNFTGGITVDGLLGLGNVSVNDAFNSNTVVLNNNAELQNFSSIVRGSWGTGNISLSAAATNILRINYGGLGNGGRDSVLGSGTAGTTANPITFSNLTIGSGSTLKFDLAGGIASQLRAGSVNIGSGTTTIEVSGVRGNQTSGNRVFLGNNTTAITNVGTPTAANQALLGSGTLTKTGSGVLQLNSSTAAGTFSGRIAISAGTVRVAGADVFDGMSNNTVTVATGAGIDYAVRLTQPQLDKVAGIPAGGVERWSTDAPRVGTTTSYTVPDGAILQIASAQTAGTGRTITLGKGSVL
jgi:fibronectin-binding autotransporter adhesin